MVKNWKIDANSKIFQKTRSSSPSPSSCASSWRLFSLLIRGKGTFFQNNRKRKKVVTNYSKTVLQVLFLNFCDNFLTFFVVLKKVCCGRRVRIILCGRRQRGLMYLENFQFEAILFFCSNFTFFNFFFLIFKRSISILQDQRQLGILNMTKKP